MQAAAEAPPFFGVKFLKSNAWFPASFSASRDLREGYTMPTTATTIVAIDILLEPDSRMLKRAKANNARLLQRFPGGFELDAAHRPHITLFQCFVPAGDLDKVYAAVGKVIESANVPSMNLVGFKYYYLPAPGGVGGAGICARPTPPLLKLQADVIAAASPFTVKTATIAAFTAPHDNPAMDTALIGYVADFVSKAAGKHFNPHVTTGVGSCEYLDRMLAEPFEPFAFSPAGAAVYQLGPFGTAARKLKGFDPQH
jgi:hypothetical protein